MAKAKKKPAARAARWNDNQAVEKICKLRACARSHEENGQAEAAEAYRSKARALKRKYRVRERDLDLFEASTTGQPAPARSPTGRRNDRRVWVNIPVVPLRSKPAIDFLFSIAEVFIGAAEAIDQATRRRR